MLTGICRFRLSAVGDKITSRESNHTTIAARDSLGSGTLRYPRERRSRPPGERSPRGEGGHGDRAAVHLGREYGQTDLRGKVSSQSEVGSRQVRPALRLQTQGQGGDQETYPNDKCEIAGRQVLQTKVRACTHWSLPKTVRPS